MHMHLVSGRCLSNFGARPRAGISTTHIPLVEMLLASNVRTACAVVVVLVFTEEAGRFCRL